MYLSISTNFKEISSGICSTKQNGIQFNKKTVQKMLTKADRKWCSVKKNNSISRYSYENTVLLIPISSANNVKSKAKVVMELSNPY